MCGKTIIKFVILLFICLTNASGTQAQVFYGLTNTGQLYSFFANSCTACLSPYQPAGILPGNLFVNGDLFVLPNGNLVITQGDQLLQYTPPNSTPIFSQTGTYYAGSAAAPGGLVYLAGGNTNPTNLYTYNPTTNVITLVGELPPGLSSLSDLFFVNGQLYGVGTSFWVWEINTSNPSLSIQFSTTFNTDFGVADNGLFIGDLGGVITYGQFNPATGATNTICNLPPGSPTFISLQQIPASAPQPVPCSCTTNAGSLNSTALTVCIPDALTTPYNNDATLDGNDVLNYVVVSNPANPLGSILFTGTSPSIPYNPALFTPGVTYYVATIAGNNLGGQVDPSDPCRDVSNLTQVVWRPKPSVQFSVASNNVCAGACLTLNAAFTGNAPFTLTYTGPGGGGSQTFGSNTGSFQYCVPAGTAAGAIQVQATQLTDTFCVCQ